MDELMERKFLSAEFYALVQIMHERNIAFLNMSDEDLAKLSIQDLNDLVKRVRSIARTPTGT